MRLLMLLTDYNRIGMPEKRLFKRIGRTFTIRHRLYKRDKSVNQHKWRIASIDNLGEGGLLFSCDCRYHIGDIAEIRIEITGEEEIACLKAQVKRIESQTIDSLYPTAIAFLDYDENDRNCIKKITKE